MDPRAAIRANEPRELETPGSRDDLLAGPGAVALRTRDLEHPRGCLDRFEIRAGVIVVDAYDLIMILGDRQLRRGALAHVHGPAHPVVAHHRDSKPGPDIEA